MFRKCVSIALFAVLVLSGASAFAKDLTETEVIAVAKDALTGKAIAFEDAVVYYDKNNENWIGWGELVAKNRSNPNHGKLPHGILDTRKYHTVYFDFAENKRKDIWVFVDADTGECITIYEIK
jgi:hypothetical protein